MYSTKRLVGLLLAAPLFSAAPSAASPTACTSGNVSYLTGLGSTGCSSGDIVFSDFTFTGGWSTGSFGFTENDDEHTFSGSALGLQAGIYSYSYKVSSTSINTFLAYRTGAATSSIVPLVSSKTFTGTPNGVTVTANNSSQSSIYFYSPPVAGPIDFTSTIAVSSGRLDVITDSFVQQIVPVPGPLPFLGAAAALRFARRLRKRSSPSPRVAPLRVV